MKSYFIAGTDTEVGKTFITCALLHAFNRQGLKTIGLKPISAGCENTDEGLRNEDALALSAAMNLDLSYEQINPVALEPAIAPHIALAQANRRVTAEQLAGYCRGAMLRDADITLIEGAGGWRVPLNSQETMANIAIELDLPVILVVGLRLGCINHALLTAQSIRDDHLPLVGWVANLVDPEMSCMEENIESLVDRMPVPLLGTVPRCESAQDAADLLDLDLLS